MLQSGEPGSSKPPISFEFRMAVVYRSEKKKILRSQINLIRKVVSVLKKVEATLTGPEENDKSRAYQGLLLEETKTEKEWREAVENNQNLSADGKAKELA